VGTTLRAAAQPNDARWFPGFRTEAVDTGAATIHAVVGGNGPPVLLLHGAPQSHVSWSRVATELARDYTVIATDLRGYGDSSKPAGGGDHAAYSKRAMAADQVAVMQHFGFERFAVFGHDRGGRVTHRLALDHPDRVTQVAVLDIVPTRYLYMHVTREFAEAYYHWVFFTRPEPLPETAIANSLESFVGRGETELSAEYLRTFRLPGTIHAMCEDYRAAASIDLAHDAADLDRRIACPLLVLWGADGAMARLYDVLAIWRERASTISGKRMPGGHSFHETHPQETLTELRAFLRA
jgi:haloacetate dehalogenase